MRQSGLPEATFRRFVEIQMCFALINCFDVDRKEILLLHQWRLQPAFSWKKFITTKTIRDGRIGQIATELNSLNQPILLSGIGE